jgi:hypothetical protein
MTDTAPDEVILTYRDTLWRLSPPWLQTGLAQQILYSIAVQLDAAGDALVAGVKLRFPNLYSAESLGPIGKERRIRRGLSEGDEPYASRLIRWWIDHRTRGGPYALLQQLFYHYSPNTFPIVLLYRSGALFVMDPDGTITPNVSVSRNVAQWARWVLLYFTDSVTMADAEDLKIIPREWIAAHCLGEIILMPTGARLWGYPRGRLWGNSELWGSGADGGRIPVGG